MDEGGALVCEWRTVKKTVFAILFLVWAPSQSFAFIVGGSNFGSYLYPYHSCGLKPTLPVKPFSFSSQEVVEGYNQKIRKYNKEIKEFSNCINDYLENANLDMQRIREKSKEAVDDLNSSF